MVYTYNPNTPEAETGGLLQIQGQSRVYNKFIVSLVSAWIA